MTALFAEQMKTPLEGPLVGHTLILETNSSFHNDEGWFLEALNSTVLHPGIVSNYSQVASLPVNNVTNCFESPPDSPGCFPMNDDDDGEIDIREFDEDATKKAQDAFSTLIPNFNRICGLIENSSDLAKANEAMNKIYEDLLQSKRDKVQDGHGAATIFSLPEVAKGNKKKRSAPSGSPLRYKR
jgi:hypothetical protein